MAYSEDGTLMAPVVDGKVQQYTSDVAKKRQAKGTDDLGKQEFLQLLVAQMQYQDPLNPSSDTEWISQMASFSSLEAMTNMGTTISNSQVFGMIGSTVIINGGTEGKIAGKVDFVTMAQGTAKLSVNGNLYTMDQVEQVVGMDYIRKQNGPKVEATQLTYDHELPQDQKINLSLGNDEYAADGFSVLISGQEKPIKSEYLTYDEKKGVLTIDKEAFRGLYAGSYQVVFVFSDAASSYSLDDVTLTVKGQRPEQPEEPEEPVEGDGGNEDGADKEDGGKTEGTE